MRKVFVFLFFGAVLAWPLVGATITITTPHGGETWSVGGTIPIAWTAVGTLEVYVNILLFQNGTKVMEIANRAPNNGHYPWTIPASVAPGSYAIRMWTADDVVTALSGSFLIVKKAVVEIPPERGPVLQFPRLAVSDVQVGANSEGFVITFGYKNAGTAALPKGSQMPVKPTFRVLIDSREIAKGDLFIPESPAPPGWTVPTFQGGVIKYLPPAGGLDYNWSIGTIVTVKINENKINGMESDSQSYNLKPMALNFGFDALITGVTMDWDKETITVNVRLDGQIGGFSQFMLFDNGVQTRFQQTIRINSGQRLYAVTQKVEGMRWCAASGCPVDLYLMVLRPGGGWAADTRDIDQRNNRHAHTYRR